MQTNELKEIHQSLQDLNKSLQEFNKSVEAILNLLEDIKKQSEKQVYEYRKSLAGTI